MATRTEIVLTCDICDTTDLVSTHEITIDGKTVIAEACDPDWNQVLTALISLYKAGRAPELTKVSAKKNIMPFPGTAWKFTAHALKRMGERHISPDAAARAADDPQIVSAGREEGAEVRRRGEIKVVVKNGVIITVSKNEEEIDDVA